MLCFLKSNSSKVLSDFLKLFNGMDDAVWVTVNSFRLYFAITFFQTREISTSLSQCPETPPDLNSIFSMTAPKTIQF